MKKKLKSKKKKKIHKLKLNFFLKKIHRLI